MWWPTALECWMYFLRGGHNNCTELVISWSVLLPQRDNVLPIKYLLWTVIIKYVIIMICKTLQSWNLDNGCHCQVFVCMLDFIQWWSFLENWIVVNISGGVIFLHIIVWYILCYITINMTAFRWVTDFFKSSHPVFIIKITTCNSIKIMEGSHLNKCIWTQTYLANYIQYYLDRCHNPLSTHD